MPPIHDTVLSAMKWRLGAHEISASVLGEPAPEAAPDSEVGELVLEH